MHIAIYPAQLKKKKTLVLMTSDIFLETFQGILVLPDTCSL